MPFVVEINTRETETLNKPIQAINFFTNIKLSLKYDSVASDFQFDYLFDPNNQDSLEIAGITHFHEAIVSFQKTGSNARQKILTGFVMNQNFVDSPTPELLSIGGYSKPGLLEKSDIPTSIPLQSDGLKLSDIIRRIASAFNLEFVIKARRAGEIVVTPSEQKTEQSRADGEIPKTTSKTSENAAAYLKTLCLQKNIVLTHDESGRLVVKTANTEGQPVLIFDADNFPGAGYEKMSLNCSGQELFKTFTVVRQADDEGGNESMATLNNPLSPVAAVPSYKVEVQTLGNDVTVVEATQNALSKSLKAIVLTVEILTETASVELILPDNTIYVRNKKLNLFKMTKFFIEKVDIEQDAQRTKQTLTCVLPWVYNYYSKGVGKNTGGPYNVFIEPLQNFPSA